MRDGLADALADLDPDVARAVLRATDVSALDPPTLTDHEWRVVVAATHGAGIYDAAPGAFRDLALAGLVDPVADLSDRDERLLLSKCLQARSWDRVVADLDYPSTRQSMRALGEAIRPLIDRHGSSAAREERRRYE